MKRSIIAIGLFIALAALGPSSSPAATPASCRNYLAKKTQKLSSMTLLHEIKCHQRRMLGTLDAATDCNDPASAGFPAESVAVLTRYTDALALAVPTRCAGLAPAALGYAACPSPCDAAVPALAALSDLAQCAICMGQESAATAASAVYGGTPPVTTTRTSAWTCQNTRVGRGMRSFGLAATNAQRSCQYKEDLGRIAPTDCKTADLTGGISRASTKLSTKVARCSDADLAALTSCGADVAAEQTCVKTAGDTMAAALFDFLFPVIPATPTPTATSTRTATMTATPTPTTDPSCAASNFLDVTNAAGPGGSYSSLRPSLAASCSSTTVTVHSNGIPTYQYQALTPNGLQAKSYNFTFPRHPTSAANTTAIPLLGNIGVAVNGIPIFGVNEGPMPAADAYGDAVAVSGLLDECGSHSAQQGTFHNHALQVKCLRQSAVTSSQPWNDPDPSPSVASPIVGYAFDGFPIYGPYECTDAVCTSVQEMRSSWEGTGYIAGTLGCSSSAACGGNGYCTDVIIGGNLTTACMPRTCTWSNHDYVAKAGAQYLDQCNGHVGPNGDYHYHTTQTFPYTLGCYRGTPTNNGGNGTPPGGSCPL